MVKRCFALMLMVWALANVAMAQSGPPTPGPLTASQTLTAALSVDADTPGFPTDLPARTVTLPDPWSQSRPGSSGPVWYRVGFQLPLQDASHPLLAVSIERACTQVELQLNGRRLHVSGNAKPTPTQNCMTPVMVTLPPALLLAGANTLDLKLIGQPMEQVATRQRAAGLSAITLGPTSDLIGSHVQQGYWQAGAAQSISVALGFLGGFLVLAGLRNRRDSALGYFGMLTLAMAAAELPHWLRQLPWSASVVEFTAASLLPLMTWGAVQFLLRSVNRQERVADILLPLQCVLMPLSLLFLGSGQLHAATQFWSTLFILEVLAAAALHLSSQWRTNRRGFWVMLLLLMAVGLGELLQFFGLQASIHILAAAGRCAMPAIIMVLGLRLVQQRGRALESAEASRALLEQRVAEVKAEIEANYRQLSELRVVQVTDRERKRIAADLHDDLGAKLLTIVHTSESERISTLAREALEEMRLSVRGLTGKPVRLEDAWATGAPRSSPGSVRRASKPSGTCPPKTFRIRCRRAPLCRPPASSGRRSTTSSSTAAPRSARCAATWPTATSNWSSRTTARAFRWKWTAAWIAATDYRA